MYKKKKGDSGRITERLLSIHMCNLAGLAKRYYLAMVPFLIKTQTKKIGVSTATNTYSKTQTIPFTVDMSEMLM